MRYNLNKRPIPATPIESYNPFDKRLADLTAPDLAILKTVIEGWHLEYKRALVSASQLAKAISSFANTYGGWLFLGVGEAGKSDPVVGSFPGIPSADLDTARQRIRQAASQHLNPTPHFETKVVVGPCEDIDLALDKAVIAVQVPQSVTGGRLRRQSPMVSDWFTRKLTGDLRDCDDVPTTPRDPWYDNGKVTFPFGRLYLSVNECPVLSYTCAFALTASFR